MFENENMAGEGFEQTEVVTATNDVEERPTENVSNESEESNKKVKSFNQEQVNELVRNRIERERSSVYKRYGVKDKDELDSLFEKSLSYEVMKERYDSINEAKMELEKKLAFLRCDIEPSKEEDVLAHFRGKGIEFNEENLQTELLTHPEWRKVVEVSDKPQTTITALSPDREQVPVMDEKSEIAKLFGLKEIL